MDFFLKKKLKKGWGVAGKDCWTGKDWGRRERRRFRRAVIS